MERLKQDYEISKNRYEEQRQALLNTHISSLNPVNATSKNQDSEPETSIQMDYFLQESDKLGKSNTAMDNILAMGQASLQSLYEDRDIFKRTKKRLLDIGNSLGLSHTVLRLIEQRTLQDKIILWTGMILTTILLGFLYIWLKG